MRWAATLLILTSVAAAQVPVRFSFADEADEAGDRLSGQIVVRDGSGTIVRVVGVKEGESASTELQPGEYSCEIGLRDREIAFEDVEVPATGGTVNLLVPRFGYAITGVLLDDEGQPAPSGTEVDLYLGTLTNKQERTEHVRVVCGASGRWYHGLSTYRHFGLRAVQPSLGSPAVRGDAWPWVPVREFDTTIHVGRLGRKPPRAKEWTLDLSPWTRGGGTATIAVLDSGTSLPVRVWYPAFADAPETSLSFRQLEDFLGVGRRVVVRRGSIGAFVEPEAGRPIVVPPLVRVSGTLQPPVAGFPLDRVLLRVKLVNGPLLNYEDLRWGQVALGRFAPGSYELAAIIRAENESCTTVVLPRVTIPERKRSHDLGVLRVGGWRSLSLPSDMIAEVVCVRRGATSITDLCTKLDNGRWLIVVPESWGFNTWWLEAGGRNARQDLDPTDLVEYRSPRISVAVDRIPESKGIRRFVLIRGVDEYALAGKRIWFGKRFPGPVDVPPGKYELTLRFEHEAHGGTAFVPLGRVNAETDEVVVVKPSDDVVRRAKAALERLQR